MKKRISSLLGIMFIAVLITGCSQQESGIDLEQYEISTAGAWKDERASVSE